MALTYKSSDFDDIIIVHFKCPIVLLVNIVSSLELIYKSIVITIYG